MDDLNTVLARLEACVREGRYEPIETDAYEVKPIPASGNAWDSIHQSVCAFLNKKGGMVILGVKEEKAPNRRFVFTGYDGSNAENLKRIRSAFTDKDGNGLDLSEHINPTSQAFMGGHIAIVRVSALPDDKRFAYFKKVPYERQLDGDKEIPPQRIALQEERKEDLRHARELRPVVDTSLRDLNLNRINQYIQELNKGGEIETLKPTLEDAMPFLTRRSFLLPSGEASTMGMLVFGAEPDRHLLQRCHLDGFIDSSTSVAEDKKTFRDNVLQLMEAGVGWTFRNIQTGVSIEAGGTRTYEYPEKLIRESINNALAHRDYSIVRPVQVTITNKRQIAIRNPGRFPPSLVFSREQPSRPVLRIFANPKPSNPRLADVLKVHDKWEGKGNGMADLTNYALRNAIDVPYYLFNSPEELSLVIPAGKVLDEGMEEWLGLFDKFISEHTAGNSLNDEQRTVLAYVIKSERENRIGRYTIALTPDNNHFKALERLEAWGLVSKHPESDPIHRVFVASEELLRDDVSSNLKDMFGDRYTALDSFYQAIVQLVYLADRYSIAGGLNAKRIYRLLSPSMMDEVRRVGEDEFYRKVRYRVQKLAPTKGAPPDADGWTSSPDKPLRVKGPANRPLFALNRTIGQGLF